MLFQKHGILGINARNLLYIRPFNKEKSVEMADDKIKTKAFLSARDIPVPKLLASISNLKQLNSFNWDKLPNEFVIKPNLGYGGEGIIPIVRRHNGHFYTAKNKEYSKEDLKDHVRNILANNFAISDSPDTAFFEKLIVTDEILGKYSHQGLPDIRVIVHNMVPVMAMLRLPTEESNGKANLHQGAIGAGIDIAKGEVTHLLYHNEIIKEIPNQGPIKGLKIPYWEEILRIACKAQLATNLGYMGADIAIDKLNGPVLLEINARAGIGIQLANMAPLRKRLERLEEIVVNTVEKGIRLGKDLFGFSIEKNIKSISGKKVIGLYETIEIIDNQNTTSAIAFINTSRKKNSISPDLAKQLGLIKSKKIKNLDNQARFTLKYKLNGKKIVSIFKIDKNTKNKYQVVLGSKDINGNFLIDPSINNLISEKVGKKNNIFITNYDSLETDRQICRVINQMKFLSYFRPLNQKEEVSKFILDKNYNPQFIYKGFQESDADFVSNLKKIKYDDSDLGNLFKEKIEELKLMTDLIAARGSDQFQDISKKLYGFPTEPIPSPKKPVLVKKTKTTKLTSLQAKEMFEHALAEYGLKDWKVLLYNKIITQCIVNKNKRIILKNNSLFSEKRVKELITHELETHILTTENGARQKYKLFQMGFANYLQSQEGLAIYNLNTQLADSSQKKHLTEAIYIGEKMGFSELYHYLRSQKLSKKSSLNICLRVKRGFSDTSTPGSFSKDFLYYKGKQEIDQFIAGGGDLKDLYLGKFNVKDLSIIKNHSTLTHSDLLLPKWLK